MTVAELITQLQALPPGAKVLTYLGDYGLSEGVATVEWARADSTRGGGEWWTKYWGKDSPKFSMGFEQVVIIS